MEPYRDANYYRELANNASSGYRQQQQTQKIEQILSEASQSGNKDELKGSIMKIISGVNPENQQAAFKYIDYIAKGMEDKERAASTDAQREALVQAGVNPDLPAALQKPAFEQGANTSRFNQIMGGGQQTTQSGDSPSFQGQEVDGGVNQPITSPQVNVNQPGTNPFSLQNATEEQLVSLMTMDEYKESAKQELKNRQERATISQKELERQTKRNEDISTPIRKEADALSSEINLQQGASDLMEYAIADKDLSFFSLDNIADKTGIDALRSPGGALFKTAGKEYFLGSLSRAGARPNQWIEQQIMQMLPKIGNSVEANLSVHRALQNELDIKKESVRLTRETAKELEAQYGYVPSDLAERRDKKLAVYINSKQKELFNDLRAIKSIADGKEQKFKPVEKDTPVSKVVVQALLNKYGNDPKKAEAAATKLGYTF